MIVISSIRQRFPWWCDAVAPVAFHVVYPVINWSTGSKYRFAKTVVRAGTQGAVKRVRNWIPKGEEGPCLISPILLRVLCKGVQTTLFKLIWLFRVALSCVIIAGHSKAMGLAKLSSNFTDLTCTVSFALAVKRLSHFYFYFYFSQSCFGLSAFSRLRKSWFICWVLEMPFITPTIHSVKKNI